MSDRIRTTALSFVWALVACERGSGPTVNPDESGEGPDSTDGIESAEGPEPGEAESAKLLAIRPVEQLLAYSYYEWSFEPGGGRLASIEHGECSVWDVRSGRMLRTFEEDEATPCEEWAELVDVYGLNRGLESADGKLEYDKQARKIKISVVGTDKVVNAIPCLHCDDAKVSWSREGHKLAIAWQERGELEIWDAAEGKKLRTESLGVIGTVDELEVGWTIGGATVAWVEETAVECEDGEYGYEYGYDYVDYDYCGYNPETGLNERLEYSRQIAVATPGKLETHFVGDEGGLEDLHFDAEGHWAIWTHSYSMRREGTQTELHIVGLSGGDSELGFTSSDDYGYGYYDYTERQGAWRNDGAIHWAMYSSYAYNYSSPSHLEWESIVTSPALGHHKGTIDGELDYDSYAKIDLFGFVGDALKFSGARCSHEDNTCTAIGVDKPKQCDLLDVASGHGSALFDCRGKAFLRTSKGMNPLGLDADMIDWWWSHGRALALTDGNTFQVLHTSAGVEVPPRQDVSSVLDARLGLELDRLVLVTEGGVELLDLTTGKALLSLAKVQASDAALSPTGDRLALLVGDELRVFEVASSKEITRFAIEGSEFAFRQDGAAIYVGSGQPDQAFDAKTGEELNSPEVRKALEDIDEAVIDGELDPSWRWVMNIETNELMRTLDARVLALGVDQMWMTDTGQFSGKPPTALAFRIGDDPWAVPAYNAEQLAHWLEQPALFETFVTGEELPAPGLTPAQAKALAAEFEARAKAKAQMSDESEAKPEPEPEPN